LALGRPKRRVVLCDAWTGAVGQLKRALHIRPCVRGSVFLGVGKRRCRRTGYRASRVLAGGEEEIGRRATSDYPERAGRGDEGDQYSTATITNVRVPPGSSAVISSSRRLPSSARPSGESMLI